MEPPERHLIWFYEDEKPIHFKEMVAASGQDNITANPPPSH
jgi:hypothetical protein